jgi:hypothetical protein
MPAQQLDLQRLVRFVLDCTTDDRLTAASVIAAADSSGEKIGIVDRWLLPIVVERSKAIAFEKARKINAVLGGEVPDWGPGRVDTFNPYKSLEFNWRLEDLLPDERIAATDFPSLWNQRPREGLHLHWDGNNDSVDERNLSAALGAGVTPVTVDHAELGRVREWIWTLPPPAYPGAIDAHLAERGEAVYGTWCASCHGDHRFREGHLVAGTRVGQVVPIAEIGTDPHRLNSYTAMLAANQNMLYPSSRFRFTHFRKTGGYANVPLDGIWARAPYLHNGSVPTVRDLLEQPSRRPKSFYRGDDVLDSVKLGFVSDVPGRGDRRFFLFDVAVSGNSNAGHLYGVDLPPEDKDALVEYLKRF